MFVPNKFLSNSIPKLTKKVSVFDPKISLFTTKGYFIFTARWNFNETSIHHELAGQTMLNRNYLGVKGFLNEILSAQQIYFPTQVFLFKVKELQNFKNQLK